MVQTSLNEIASVEVKDIVDSLLNLPSNVKNFGSTSQVMTMYRDYPQFAYNPSIS